MSRTSFSKRSGIEKAKPVQRSEMDERLRVGLWNALYADYFSKMQVSAQDKGFSDNKSKAMAYRIWMGVLYRPVDEIPQNVPEFVRHVKEEFLNAAWNRTYDIIEFVARKDSDSTHRKEFTSLCNNILEEERSAYRFVGNDLSDITSELEIASIETALSVGCAPSRQLFRKALKEYSDRDNPDFANSIKDSVSAVESLCKVIANDGSKTLPESLKKVGEQLDVHPALLSSLNALYGYRNVRPGVGHGSTGTISEGHDEALFFLVSCSGWINYLSMQAQKNGIKT